ncbi:MAG: UDP-glucose--hexose-1-phosphate uridylyltransferase [Candidatus Marinimicrobia bacterium]|nr:UDP-glucose--hexose-1-phosphate uridylyltransferase [Candidatus Neomarinimicrobiota bacterium]
MNRPGDNPHRRYNPLTGEWVLVSAHRTERPWLGQQEERPKTAHPQHDPKCYLCPGGIRATGVKNPEYEGTFVFTNDYPALLPELLQQEQQTGDELRSWENVCGTSRVICYSPRHDLTLPKLPLKAIERVITTWLEQSRQLASDYKWVQIFENKGEIMGASNPHPHGQIWAGDFVPTEVLKEDQCQLDYLNNHDQPLLLDYAKSELELNERIVWQNESWVALVPFWAVWPFETIIVPLTWITRMVDLNGKLIKDLAELLKVLLTKYDHLFDISFPYSMGWHGTPNGDESCDHWTLHTHIYPPLLRSATIKKFLVGYEMLAESQRDLTPESVARRLAALPENY